MTYSSGVDHRRDCNYLGEGVLVVKDRSKFGLGSRSVGLEEKLETRWAMEVERCGEG